MDDILATQIASSATVVWLIQWAKMKLGLEGAAGIRVARLFSAILAVATAAGIQYTFDTDHGILTITGLTVANGFSFLWHAFQQFVGQEVIYKAAYNKTAVAVGTGDGK